MSVRYRGRHDDDPDFAAKADAAFSVRADTVVAVLLAMDADGEAVGHAALRRLGDLLEVKKVFVDEDGRGVGTGHALMDGVEHIARELGAHSLVLQTGDRQPDAVRLYEGIGYRRVPVFDPYRPITNSMCFEKRLDLPVQHPRSFARVLD